MKDDLEPIDPGLASLLEAERRDVSGDAAAKARGLARLEAALPTTGLPAGRPPLRAGPIVTAFVVGGLVGAGLVAGLRPPTVVYVDRPVASTPPVPIAPLAPAAPLASPIIVAPEPSPIPAATVRAEDALARERAILDVAHTALGRRDGARALDAASRHSREFPRGQMSEKREAIAIQALVLVGRRDEAKTRADRFRARWSASVFLPVVDAATSE